MLKKYMFFSLVMATSLSCNASEASLQDYYFATVKAGIFSPAASPDGNSNLNKGDSGFTGSILAGRKFMDRYSLDIEYQYRDENKAKNYSATGSNNIYANNSWEARSNMFMANFSFDLLTEKSFRPYVRAGLGVSQNKASDYISTDENGDTITFSGKNTNKFAYQIGAGISFCSFDNMDTQFEYMYIDRDKIETNAYTSQSGTVYPAKYGYLKDHVFTVGIKYKF